MRIIPISCRSFCPTLQLAPPSSSAAAGACWVQPQKAQKQREEMGWDLPEHPKNYPGSFLWGSEETQMPVTGCHLCVSPSEMSFGAAKLVPGTSPSSSTTW